MVILVTGVAGVGKTTVGRELARQLGWTFLDADDDHPAANVEKMRAGVPLTDADRAPWLAAVRSRLELHVRNGEDVVLACSALKRAYRDYLAEVGGRVLFVHLRTHTAIVMQRLKARRGHFAGADLLDSQQRALEAPDGAIVVDASQPVAGIVDAIRAQL